MMAGNLERKRSVTELVDAAGGADAVAMRIGKTSFAVYKWKTIGIPEYHWHILIDLIGTTPDELYRANRIARGCPGDRC